MAYIVFSKYIMMWINFKNKGFNCALKLIFKLKESILIWFLLVQYFQEKTLQISHVNVRNYTCDIINYYFTVLGTTDS